ncbi:MAG: DUF1456 family protein [Vallitaleaceae bacterium]|nr:DUF1456 family protein [Vallitaleaceae bacterium]
MNNNEILIRLRYALDIKNSDVIQIFRLGGIQVTLEEVSGLLSKEWKEITNDIQSQEMLQKNEKFVLCSNKMLDGFLNGFIQFKRGPQPNQDTPKVITDEKVSMNNLLLKKLKIALSLTGEDMLEIFTLAETKISKGELGNLMRKQDDRKYVECKDNYARKFLKGLTIKYRKK